MDTSELERERLLSLVSLELERDLRSFDAPGLDERDLERDLLGDLERDSDFDRDRESDLERDRDWCCCCGCLALLPAMDINFA